MSNIIMCNLSLCNNCRTFIQVPIQSIQSWIFAPLSEISSLCFALIQCTVFLMQKSSTGIRSCLENKDLDIMPDKTFSPRSLLPPGFMGSYHVGLLICLLSSYVWLHSVVTADSAELLLPRPKRLSVLNIMYRKGSMDNSTRRYQSYYTPAQPTTITAIENTTGPKFTQNDLADAIANLRTTRVRFSMSSRSPSVDSTETTTSTSTTTSSSTQPPIRERPPFEVRRVSFDVPPSQQLPYAPPVAPKRTPSLRLPPTTHPYIHPVDRIKEYPATRQPPIIYTFDRPETLNPSYHELMPPTPPRTPSAPLSTTVSHTPHYVTVHNTPTVPPRVHWTPSPPRSFQTPSPTFQARLNINPERKSKKTTSTPLRRASSTSTPLPWMTSKNITTTTPIGSGAPMAASCRGRIGYFSDMSPECNAFLYCDQFGRSFRFLCPDGSQFNPRMCLCDMHSVQCSVTGPIVSFDDPCPPLL